MSIVFSPFKIRARVVPLAHPLEIISAVVQSVPVYVVYGGFVFRVIIGAERRCH